jgi:hypothetical protein
MRFIVGLVFIVHGFAHTVGFVVPWKIASLDEAPYKTTVLGGRLDLGHGGIRFVGILWLLAALAFFGAGALVIGRFEVWQPFTLSTTVFSLLLCFMGLPDSRLGIPINIVILVFILAGGALGWLNTIGI